ncbi:YdhK family protein [Saccharibacillus alkalitolerans]|uniref:YdhK family protein n=1 Tax=Saccharibacillus alkalitolerans TaxID=2705290 RepID=A0ABX0EZL6_9BACL|nr:YdhK family protein [Saccharibacillus alkalitolerans]NGZ74183.1 YdhK family protein [Saccharibacillus alkalitolerans]
MKRSLNWLFAAAAASSMLLAGCSGKTPETGKAPAVTESESEQSSMADMHHGSSGEMPAGLKDAADAAYPVGAEVTIHADHMPGMEGARAVVSGAYDTTIYSVSYTPTDGGEPVKGHKWVIREEVKPSDSREPAQGDTVTIEADHMAGMKGAEATIETADQGVAYMLDYTPTTGGEPVKNHMWVTEDELSAE